MPNLLAIVGCEDGAAGQISCWIEKQGYKIAYYVNPSDTPLVVIRKQRDASRFSYPSKDEFKGKPLINSSDWGKILYEKEIEHCLVTTDDNHLRYEQIHRARQCGLHLINAIHPSALIMEDVILEDNIIIYPNSYIGYRSEICVGSIICSAHLDHHNVVKDCAIIDPGVVTAGNVTIGKYAQIHTGTFIKNNIKIGDNAILGCGTVIIGDIPSDVTVVGVPGKIIKYHKA